MTEPPENNLNHSDDDYQKRQQEMQLHEEELRLEQEESRLQQARHNQIVNRLLRGMFFLVTALEILLILRFILKFANANPDNLFATVIYSWSSPFVAPFTNLFTNIDFGGSVLEINTITAMIIYGLLATLGTRLVEIISGR